MSNRPEFWTYCNRGQGLHRGDELQPWRRRLAFPTVARPSSTADPSNPTPKIAADLNVGDQLFLPRPRQGRGSGDRGGEAERQRRRRDREMERWEGEQRWNRRREVFFRNWSPLRFCKRHVARGRAWTGQNGSVPVQYGEQ